MSTSTGLHQRPDGNPEPEPEPQHERASKRIKLQNKETVSMSGSFLSPDRTNDGGVGEGLEYSKCVISADAIRVTQSSDHFDDVCVGQDPPDSVEDDVDTELEPEDHCTICLQPFLDRTIIPTCTHEFCFECILMWAGV